jgi:hypothetical protein
MTRGVLTAGACVLGLALASPAIAADHITLLLDSGQRITGELVDLSNSGFTVRVNGREENYKTGEVAVVDFSGNATNLPSSELNQLGNGQAVVLSNGQVLKGRLYDVGGSNPLTLRVKMDAGGEREFKSSEVRRVYLSRPSASSAAATTAPAPQGTTGTTIIVPANRQWVDTGITVRSGQMVSFNGSGEVQLSPDNGDKATPDGSIRGTHPPSPMANTLAGALIGRIGPVTMFGIGTQRQPLPMPADGRLFIGINDNTPNNNRGEFRVEISPGR